MLGTSALSLALRFRTAGAPAPLAPANAVSSVQAPVPRAGAFAVEITMKVKIEVIPWETKAGQFGVAIERDGKAEAYFVGSRSEAEQEARRKLESRDRRSA